ncbi:PadR family transcriptional regulator [Segeticoccus rhizosphaerae]|uniref:PadR family transcriptional regulator n=1 Tax=Segeticoccus rhizosphaerae TaxID=1104777 RepID=UPI0010C0D01B|nr:PadR family transcriptional regulator [Ornithinicoccus soli]
MREFIRGAVRLHILHHAAEGEIHGAWMADELAHHGYQISPGTLYPTLHRLQERRLLTSRQVVVAGRARRVYTITDTGRAVLAQERRALAELAREVLGPDVGQWPETR